MKKPMSKPVKCKSARSAQLTSMLKKALAQPGVKEAMAVYDSYRLCQSGAGVVGTSHMSLSDVSVS
jgi:hypothetical protein